MVQRRHYGSARHRARGSVDAVRVACVWSSVYMSEGVYGVIYCYLDERWSNEHI